MRKVYYSRDNVSNMKFAKLHFFVGASRADATCGGYIVLVAQEGRLAEWIPVSCLPPGESLGEFFGA
jgi:hypothetical protein